MALETLYVTSIKPNRGFLQICGHKKPALLAQLESEISAYQPAIKKLATQDELYPNLEFDTIYLAHSTGKDKYHRCVVREKRPGNKALIELIDYGNEFEVDANLLLELDPKNKIANFLNDFPPIATNYILANFCCSWKSDEWRLIESLLTKAVLPITNEQMDREHRYISLNFKGQDLMAKLTNSNIGMEISFTEQRMEIRKIHERSYNHIFSNGAASPARRVKGRNLVPNRPLQTSSNHNNNNNNNNNNTITNQSKRMIQNFVLSNKPHTQSGTFHPEVSVTDGIVQSTTSRIPAFTATELQIGQFHAVYCSYVEDGPNLFWVQLKSHNHLLDRMTSDLANAPRTPITTKLSIGMACIARFSEDRALYRAVIQNVQSTGCRVTFVDFGNSEFVGFDDLYEIPNHFLENKTFAMSFQLHGCKELGTISPRLKDFFNSLVENENLLDLKVVPSKNMLVQQCELYIANGLNILDMLKEKKNEFSTFPNPPQLTNNDYVYIRAALTANKFYVQRCSENEAFEKMMDNLFQHCLQTPQMTVLPPNGKCCAAMANGDSKEWYRAIVLNQLDSQRVQVQFVDFGLELPCRLADLRDIPLKFLELPRQAIECCLVDFEDIANVSETTGAQLSMLIEDDDGKLIAYKTLLKKRLPTGTYVVDLYDESKDLNVSISVYKIAMPRRHFNKQVKAVNEVEKPARAVQSNRTNQRECDGAENQDKFLEANAGAERQRERYSGNRSEDFTRSEYAKANKPQSDTPKSVQNGSSKNYGNRSDYDNRRNTDNNKSVDKNDNLDSTMGDSTGSLTDTSSKSSEKGVNKPTFVPITSEDFVGLNPNLPSAIPFPLNSSSKMNLVYWNSPFEFFMQLKSMENNCEEMMHQINQFYRKRTPIQQKVPKGSLVVVRHKEDRVLKRARVIDYNQQRDKYRVEFIDYGNRAVCSLSEMYELEKSFVKLPAMAIRCTLTPAILNKSLADIQEKIRPFLDNSVNIECTMIQQDQNNNTVEMKVNGQNLKDFLIRENVLNNLPKDVCLERLVGQTLMAYVIAVTDLSSFQATFYGCDIAFMCSYKDLNLVKKNSQLVEQLRAAERKHVRVKVESIGKDNVLLMSIYLPNFDEDNDLPDICNYPIFNEEFTGMFGHLEPPFTVYIHNSAHQAQIQKLLDDLYAAYETGGTVCTEPNLKQTYAVLSLTDSNYYRCRVESFQNNDEVVVRMIDYGNIEVVKKSALKVLTDRFAAPISALVHKMYVPVKFADGYSIEDLDMNVFPNVRILGTHGKHFICDLFENGASMIETLKPKAERLDVEQLKQLIVRAEEDGRRLASQVNVTQQQIDNEASPAQVAAIVQVTTPAEVAISSQLAAPMQTATPMEVAAPVQVNAIETSENEKTVTRVTPSTIETMEPVDLSNNSTQVIDTTQVEALPEQNVSYEVGKNREIAFLSHVDDPSRFYMQLQSYSDAINSLQQTLQIVAPQLPALSDFRTGQMCICKYSVDDEWYRAKIIDTDGNITSIQFIDFGNTDSITDNSLLKTPERSLTEREAFAISASLPIEKRGSSEWSEAACNKLKTLLNQETPIQFELVSKDKDVSYMKIFVDGGRDLVKEMIEEQLAEPLEIVRSGEIVFVSHANSISDFFIQVQSETIALQKIEQHLEINSNTELLNPSEGTICSAKFEDDKFYRARILRVLPESKSFQVEFLDYGNTFTTTELRSLMPEIAQLPHLRKRCSLKMPDNVQHWSDEAEKRFLELAGDGATEFKVQLIKPGEAACIELFMGDQNVSDLLSELCEKMAAPAVVIDEQESTLIEKTASLSINVNDFPSGRQNCRLVHANAPSDFFIQTTDTRDELHLIEAELGKVDELEMIDQKLVEVGMIVAALFPDDEMYYRAKVIECSSNGFNVFFIDYGNTCLVTDIRKLPSMISTLIPLARNCTLSNDQLQQFTENDTKHFMMFMSEFEEPTFQVEAITVATKSTVQFYRDGLEILAFIRQKLNETNAHDSVASTVLSDIIEEATATRE